MDLDNLRHSAVTGLPDEVAHLHTFADIGARRACLQVLDLDYLDHLALIAAEVLPRVTPSTVGKPVVGIERAPS